MAQRAEQIARSRQRIGAAELHHAWQRLEWHVVPLGIENAQAISRLSREFRRTAILREAVEWAADRIVVGSQTRPRRPRDAQS